ncbi:MAG: hypothetical protein ACO3ZG_08820 [Kiritimatiellia bacterium]
MLANKTFKMLLMFLPVMGTITGCDPMTSQDRAYFNRREEIRADRERMMRQASDEVRPEDLFELVRSSAGPQGEATVAEWLEQHTQAMGGQVMFPRWSTTRPGSNKQDVRFGFVHIDEANNTRNVAYVWPVDVLTMTVGEMRMDAVEQSNAPGQSIIEQEQRRIREHEQALR